MVSFSSTSTPSPPQGALSPFSTHPVFVLMAARTQVQDLARGLVELHGVHTSLSLKPVRVPQDAIPSLQHDDHTTWPSAVSKISEHALDSTVHVNNNVRQHQCRHQPLRNDDHLHLDIKMLTTTLSVQSSHQFLI